MCSLVWVHSLEDGQLTSTDQCNVSLSPVSICCQQWLMQTHNLSECRDVSDCGVFNSMSPLTSRLRGDLGRDGGSIVWEDYRSLSSGQDTVTALVCSTVVASSHGWMCALAKDYGYWAEESHWGYFYVILIMDKVLLSLACGKEFWDLPFFPPSWGP